MLKIFNKTYFKIKNIFFDFYIKKKRFINNEQFLNFLKKKNKITSKTTDELIITKLKDWSYTFLKRPYSKKYCLDNLFSYRVYDQKIYKLYNFLYEKNNFGFWCGGHAVFLKKIYTLFGYKAKTLNIGNPKHPRGSHVFTLVKIKDKIILIDCYFNNILTDRKGNFINLKKYIKKLKKNYKKNKSIVKFTANKKLKKIFILSKFEYKNFDNNQKCKIKYSKSYNEYILAKQNFTLENYIFDEISHSPNTNFLNAIETFSKKRGFLSILLCEIIGKKIKLEEFLKNF